MNEAMPHEDGGRACDAGAARACDGDLTAEDVPDVITVEKHVAAIFPKLALPTHYAATFDRRVRAVWMYLRSHHVRPQPERDLSAERRMTRPSGGGWISITPHDRLRSHCHLCRMREQSETHAR
jgi:hypothetical protein